MTNHKMQYENNILFKTFFSRSFLWEQFWPHFFGKIHWEKYEKEK